MAIDELDFKILKLLRNDARLSYRKIAEQLKVATGTVQHRVQKLEEEGVITDYHAGIDLSKLGYAIGAIIGLSINRGETDKLEKKLKENNNVYAVYSVTGDYDLFIGVRMKSMNELNNFVRNELSDPAISKTNTFIILDVSKETYTFLS